MKIKSLGQKDSFKIVEEAQDIIEALETIFSYILQSHSIAERSRRVSRRLVKNTEA